MPPPLPGPEFSPSFEQVLGYLNFSDGAGDPALLTGLDHLYQWAGDDAEPWRAVLNELLARLDQFHRDGRAGFDDTTQAEAALRLTRDTLAQAYWDFHENLLFHQRLGDVLNSFLLGRMLDALLQQDSQLDERERCERTIRQLNDYIGHRPVPALETQKLEPYPHEWIRPVPLFVRGAGICSGPYYKVVKIALAILENTPEHLLRDACFSVQRLDELAFDPRAYDFDHPANKRPNYHFGQWDPHHIDSQGRYERYVVQQVSLDALQARLLSDEAPVEELLEEAGAVLAGTILMGAGVSGWGPGCHGSSVTLANLLPHIARYRDEFYVHLIHQLKGEHRQRLERESADRRQPFGAARQHLNAQLSRRRAMQQQHVHLARVFAVMGHPQAAQKQADVVPVASARILCRMECELTAGMDAARCARVEEAAERGERVWQFLQQGIQCGALADPWSILGFDCNFSLFPAVDNSVHDHRIDDLVSMVDRIFELFARSWSAAAAAENAPLTERLESQFLDAARWWRQFAAHEVSSIESEDPELALSAARHVAESISLWHKEGASAGDIRFWAPHAERFDSPRAFALVIETLLDHTDYVASMGLLVHWLSQSHRVPLEQADNSFQRCCLQWVQAVAEKHRDEPQTAWERASKFLNYLEANAEEHWQVPRFELQTNRRGSPDDGAARDEDNEGDVSDDDPEGGLFDAAYEEVVFRDSADDGVEGELAGSAGSASEDELAREAQRVDSRLVFLSAVAKLMRVTSLPALRIHAASPGDPKNSPRPCHDQLRQWVRHAGQVRRDLIALMRQVAAYPLPAPSGDHDSMVEYDRQRMMKESLLERIMATHVDVSNAWRLLIAVARASLLSGKGAARDPVQEGSEQAGSEQAGSEQAGSEQAGSDEAGSDEATGNAVHEMTDAPGAANEVGSERPPSAEGGNPEAIADAFLDGAELTDEERAAAELTAELLSLRSEAAREKFARYLAAIRDLPALYVPLARRGEPTRIVAVRARQHTLRDLLTLLPRAGLLRETGVLLETVREMERRQPPRSGAVTEFDDLFSTGFRALVEQLVCSAGHWNHDQSTRERQASLVSFLEQLTESVLISWLTHSRTLRLSVLERVAETAPWDRIVEFIQRYGGDLFTQQFLNIANLRAILHCGVESWLEMLQAETPDAFLLLEDIGRRVTLAEAAEQLTIILESVVENYAEYRDYNTTTTLSDDGGMLFSLLDFLRLRSRYDRVCWHLRPVVVAHEILVRRGQDEAAQMWRRALNERIQDESQKYLDELKQLQRKYSMRLPTVADRLGERFVKPLHIDRMLALVKSSMSDVPPERSTFELLEAEAASLAEEATGVGLDLPGWLLAMEEEVARLREPAPGREWAMDELGLPALEMSAEEISDQLDHWRDD